MDSIENSVFTITAPCIIGMMNSGRKYARLTLKKRFGQGMRARSRRLAKPIRRTQSVKAANRMPIHEWAYATA